MASACAQAPVARVFQRIDIGRVMKADEGFTGGRLAGQLTVRLEPAQLLTEIEHARLPGDGQRVVTAKGGLAENVAGDETGFAGRRWRRDRLSGVGRRAAQNPFPIGEFMILIIVFDFPNKLHLYSRKSVIHHQERVPL